MGDVIKQDKTVTLDVIHRLIEGLEEYFLNELEPAAKEKISDAALFILASFLGGLRGEETLKLVLGEARQYITEAENHCKHKHVILPLRGRFKGETGESFHFLAVTAETDSGLRIGCWLKRSLEFKEERGATRGFLFVDGKEKRLKLRNLEPFILDRVARVQSSFPDLIRESVDVHEEYGLSRSFRRGSNSEALNRGVDEATIDRNNRWRKIERAGARKAKLRMRDHYAEVLVSLRSFLKYSQAL